MAPPTPHCMRYNNYLPPPDTRFGTKYFHLKQPKKPWHTQRPCNIGLKWSKPLPLGKLHQLAECTKELRRCIRTLTEFMDEQVLSKDPP